MAVKKNMPRQPRIDIPGALYHVIARGIERRKIFRDSKDKKRFLYRFADLITETKVSCYAWSLLSNHIHLLLSPTETPLHAFMHRLLTGYAVNFNYRHKRSGHLFQNRYRSILCQEEAYFQQLVRYIHCNPLRAGLVKTLAELDRYPWCGHSALVGKIPRPWQAVRETLRHFGVKTGRARSVYRKYMGEDGEDKEEEQFLGGGLIRSAGGWEEVKALGRAGDAWASDERILGDGDFVKGIIRQLEARGEKKARLRKEGCDFGKVVEYISVRTGVESERIALKCKGKVGAEARTLVAYLCRHILDMRVTEIGENLGVTQSAASQLIRKGRKKGEKLRLSGL